MEDIEVFAIGEDGTERKIAGVRTFTVDIDSGTMTANYEPIDTRRWNQPITGTLEIKTETAANLIRTGLYGTIDAEEAARRIGSFWFEDTETGERIYLGATDGPYDATLHGTRKGPG